MESIVCHCFGYTTSDIQRDVMMHGKSTIMDKIIAQKKNGWMLMCNKKSHWPLMSPRRPPGSG